MRGRNLPSPTKAITFSTAAAGIGGKAVRPGAAEHTNDRIVLQQRQVHRYRRDLAPGKSNRHQPSIPPHEAGERRKERATDVVDANVNPFAVREDLHPVTHIFARMVDDL